MSAKKTAIQSAIPHTGPDINLQDVADAVEDELLVIDSNYKVRFANSAAIARLQTGTESPVGRLCYEVSYHRDKPCAEPLWDCPLKKVLKSGSMTTVVHPLHTPNTVTYLRVTAYPFWDDRDKKKAIVELRRDVSAERELEVQMLRRHRQLLALNEISNAVSGLQDLDTILDIALDTVLDIVNGTIGGILLMDREPDTLYYRTYRGLSDKYAKGIEVKPGEGIAGRVAQTGEPTLLEDASEDPHTANLDLVKAERLRGFVSTPLKSKDRVVGVMNIASHTAGQFDTDDLSLLNSIGGYLGTAIEQANLNTRLTRAGERYRALLQHALTAQEDERKRVARELHDETAQAITSLTLGLQAAIQIAEMKSNDNADLIDRLKKTHANAVHAGNEVVKLMKELRPTLLDELGLPAAIHRYAKDTLEAKGINVSMEFKGTDERFPQEVEVTLFRVAQGLIGNILEHSEAKNVSIKLERSANECVLRIEDDGKGFDVNKVTRVEPSGRGAGLFTMRERMRLVGGTGRVMSKPGRGTTAIASAPIGRSIVDDEDIGTDS
ncbi:GAF domain-containing protein [Chloroflexota bacterium]